MTTEIKLIHNKEENYYRVTVNGIDHYGDFKHNNDPDEEAEVRRTAKAVAFDECLKAQINGKLTISYLSH